MRSAYCGKREIMKVLSEKKIDTVGTYYGHPLSMTAVITTIKELEKDGGAAFRHIDPDQPVFVVALVMILAEVA